ncbi:MAG: peptidoglycan-binding protein [Clostridiales bacterium]|nr:peptidoglycan-binding protein [Clostridiales bacterium]
MLYPTLRYCARGSEVVRLQLMLRELGFTLTPDGFLGPMTREAVRTFQALRCPPATGEVDPLTWDALESRYHAAVCMQDTSPVHTVHDNEPNRRDPNESIQGAEPPPGRNAFELAGHVSQAL